MPLAPATLPNLYVGPSIQVDPGFAYYKNRSAESVAREIEVNGYKIVRFIVTDDDDVDDRLISAFHARGMAVWYQTFGNGFYGQASGMPADWKSWQMGLLNDTGGLGYTFMSLSCPAYREWKQARIVGTIRKHRFDAVEVVEPFQMGWGGPQVGSYGDLSHWSTDAFRAYSGYDAPPEFKDKTSPRWYKTDTQRYSKWVEFRGHEVDQFLAGIASAVRNAAPGKPFAFWALANSSPDPKINPADLAREWQGIDAVSMAKACKPDMVCFQTNWPDWSNPSLRGSYPNSYRPLTEPLRKAFPKLPFIVQADIGSNEDMRRSREWIAEFEKTCLAIGASGSTAYMYNIGLWMYTEAPQVRHVERTKDGLMLVFQKRLDPATAGDATHYSIAGLKVQSARADGNLVFLRTALPRKTTRFVLRVDGVKDDPTTWEFKGKPANTAKQTLDVKL